MISIIICSRHSDVSEEQRHNIESTIGCPHEIIFIDNSGNQYDLYQAYNEGVRKSTGDVLLFIHDDVTYKCNGWGLTIERILKDESIGLVGVLGSHVIPDFPAYYSESPYLSGNNADNDNGAVRSFSEGNWDDNGLVDVAVVDGQQLFMPRRLFPPLAFDDRHYHGFHGYDMDISMQVHSIGKRVVVTNKIISEHQWSESKWDDEGMTRPLYASMQVFVDKWSDQLPMVVGIDKPSVEIDNMMNLWHDSCRYRQMRQSKAYRLGKALLKPFSMFNRK